MSLLWMDGFDHYAGASASVPTYAAGAYDSIGSGAIFSTFPVLGGLSYDSYDTGMLAKAIPSHSAGSVLGAGFHAVFSAGFWSGNKNLFHFASSPGGSGTGMIARRDDGVILVDGVATSFTAATGTVYHFEVKVTLHASAGSIALRINGQDVYTASGLSLAGPFSYFLTGDHSSSGSASMKIKNLYVWDDSGSGNKDWLGERLIETSFVDGDTATADWSISVGSNGYDMLNDVPSAPGTNYVQSDVIGDRSIFEFPALSNEDVTVAAVMLVVQGLKTGSGAGSMKLGIVQGSTEVQSSEKALSTDQPLYYSQMVEDNPDTTSPWVSTDLATTKIVLERTA